MASNKESCSDKDVFRYIWDIENYDFFYSERGDCLKSPEFSHAILGPIHLELYPKGDLFDNEEYVILCLSTSSKQKNFTVDCEMKHTQTMFAKEINNHYPKWKFKKYKTPTSPKLKLNKLPSLPAILTVICEFQVSKHVKEGNFTSDDEKDLQDLSDEMEKMCCDPRFSDFTLVYQDTKFPLHKIILSARVPKLAEDLKIEECSEATLYIYKSVVVTSEAVRNFLVYIYSGKLPLHSTDIVRGLSYFSDHYEVTDLKKKLQYYPTESVVRTFVKYDRKTFTWSVGDFEKIKFNEQFHGPAFSSGTVSSSDVHFMGYVENDKEGNLDIRVCICRLFPDKDVPIFVQCKISVLNVLKENCDFVADHYFKEDAEWKLPSFFKLKQIDGENGIFCCQNGQNVDLKKSQLYLKVEFFISGKEIFTQVVTTGSFLTSQSDISSSSNDAKSLSLDLGKLYNIFLPKQSDVVLHVGDVRFPAHMAILSARSPVFSRMFEHNMVEKEKEAVDILDIDVGTLNLMLIYLYTGKVDIVLNYDSALNLYAAADKYDITSLRKKCTTILKSKLTSDTVCNLLVFADMHSDKTLKTYAIDYIRDKSVIILKLPEWKQLIIDRPDLATDVIQILMSLILYHEDSCTHCPTNKSP